MKRCKRGKHFALFVLVIGWFLSYGMTVDAADTDLLYRKQATASGAASLVQTLPANVREVLDAMDWDVTEPGSYLSVDVPSFLRGLITCVDREKSGALQAIVSLIGVVAVSTVFGGMENSSSLGLKKTYHTVTALSTAGLLISPLLVLLDSIRETVESVSVFMVSFVPVYAGLLAAGGESVRAVSYQSVLLFTAELLAQLIRTVILPMLSLSLAFGCTGSMTEEMHLDALGAFFYRCILWALGLISTLFSFFLSVQQMVAAAGDSVGNRAVKFSLSSFVPVVGGALSEAYSTVIGCLGLLRSTVGCFGLVATVLIILPPLVQCLCWCLCLRAGETVAALFGLQTVQKLCQTLIGAVRVLIAVLAVYALLMTVSTTVMVFVGKGGAA